MNAHVKAIADKLRPYMNDIFLFAELLGFEPTYYQAQALMAVMKSTYQLPGQKRQIAIRSAQGCGKTAVSSIIGLWRLLRVPQSMVVVTAASARQCREVYLTEAKRWMDKAPNWLQALVDIQATKIIVNNDPAWVLNTATATDSRKMAGYHEDNLCFIVEEASAVENDVLEVIQGTLSQPGNLLVCIGNPTCGASAKFFKMFHEERHLWETFHFSALEGAKYYPHIVDPGRNRIIADTFGADSVTYAIRVLGEFALEGNNTIMTKMLVKTCVDPHDRLRCVAMGKERVFGWDVARFGGDESVVYLRSGNAAVKWDKFTDKEPYEIREWMLEQQASRCWTDEETWFVVDTDGMGQGVVGDLYRENKNVYEFHNNGTANDPTMFSNQITEAYFHLAKLFKERRINIPDDPILIEQLTTRQYELNEKGQIQIERKKDYVKRMKKEAGENATSPDRADALAMAFHPNVVASSNFAAAG